VRTALKTQTALNTIHVIVTCVYGLLDYVRQLLVAQRVQLRPQVLLGWFCVASECHPLPHGALRSDRTGSGLKDVVSYVSL
jgi:hypothetical protein